MHDTRTPIRSTWRDAIGKPLTDHRIHQYALTGRYGDAIMALARLDEAARLLRRKITKQRRAQFAARIAEYV